MTKKYCSKCNKDFECKADERGCWCESFTLSGDALAQLKNDFADCLCPACLSAYQDIGEHKISDLSAGKQV